jgi:hypothetical protein
VSGSLCVLQDSVSPIISVGDQKTALTETDLNRRVTA